MATQGKLQFTIFLNVNPFYTMNHLCLYAVETETQVASTETSQVAAAASQTDENVTAREELYRDSMAVMIYQFLSHTIDMKNSKLTDRLVKNNILSHDEREDINKQKKTDDKVDTLIMMLRKRSAARFERFLTTLSETGQQSISDAVHQALHMVGLSGRNPLQYVRGKTVLSN